MISNQAVSFFIHVLLSLEDNVNVQAYALLDNNKTNECLVIKGNDEQYVNRTTISRYPIGASAAWINEMGHYEHVDEYDYRNVIIEI
jgi:hypothetical protein